MFIIKKFTQNYDRTEDRISLTCQNAAGEKIRLWITHRLIMRLAEALIRFLKDEMQSVTVGRMARGMHEFEQGAALAGMKPQAPVESDLLRDDVLVTSIDLTSIPSGYRVIFRWKEENAAGLVLDNIQLRQFLIIAWNLFGVAGWSRHVWPAWFSNESALAGLAEPAMLH